MTNAHWAILVAVIGGAFTIVFALVAAYNSDKRGSNRGVWVTLLTLVLTAVTAAACWYTLPTVVSDKKVREEYREKVLEAHKKCFNQCAEAAGERLENGEKKP